MPITPPSHRYCRRMDWRERWWGSLAGSWTLWELFVDTFLKRPGFFCILQLFLCFPLRVRRGQRIFTKMFYSMLRDCPTYVNKTLLSALISLGISVNWGLSYGTGQEAKKCKTKFFSSKGNWTRSRGATQVETELFLNAFISERYERVRHSKTLLFSTFI